MSHKLLLLTRENRTYQHLLAQQDLEDLELLDDSPSAIAAADIWLAEPALAAPLLPHAKALQWLQSTFAGVEKLLTPRSRQDYLLTNINGCFGPLMSEYVFGYLLARCRQQSHYQQQQQQSLWLPGAYHTLAGQHLLLLGTGAIGNHLAQTGKHFAMNISGFNRSGQSTPYIDTIVTLSSLNQALADADVVINTLPATAASQQLLDVARLACLKANATLINVGRGSTMDYDALLQQLQQRPAMSAILDVFPNEPLPAEHPLWRQPNAIITPHISAPSFPQQVVQQFSDNYQRLRQQQPLHGQIQFSRGY